MRLVVGIVVAGAVAALVMSSAPRAEGMAGFGDVAAGRYFSEPVQWMVDNGITTGTSATCFSPDDAVTRGQAAAFMWRMEGFPASGEPHSFTDVVAPWQQDPVSWMSNNEITTGTTPLTYAPDDRLTRGQAAALLHRLAGSPPAPPPTQFPDVVKAWQITPVGWMLVNDITTGTSLTTFSPDDTVTRGQLAAFFYRYKGSPPVVVDGFSPPCPKGVALSGDGIGVARFGDSADTTLGTLIAIFGEPSYDTGWGDPHEPENEPLWPGCPGSVARLVGWSGGGGGPGPMLGLVLTDWDPSSADWQATVSEPWFAGASIGPGFFDEDDGTYLFAIRTAAGATAGNRLGTLRDIYGPRLYVSPVPDEAVELYWFAVDGDHSPLHRDGGVRGWLFWKNVAEISPDGPPTDEWVTRGLISGVSCSSP